MVASISAAVYNLINLSYVGAGLEFVAIVSAIVSLTLIIKQSKNKTNANKFDFA